MFKFREDKTCHHSAYNALYSHLFVSIRELWVYSAFGCDSPNSSNLKAWDQLECLDVDGITIIKWINIKINRDNCNCFEIAMVVFALMLYRSRRHSVDTVGSSVSPVGFHLLTWRRILGNWTSVLFRSAEKLYSFQGIKMHLSRLVWYAFVLRCSNLLRRSIFLPSSVF
jgi:hypothetical protein